MFWLILAISVILNLLLGWYVVKLLRKFFFISENLADLFLILRALQTFVEGMYSTDTYHGEPTLQELIFRLRETTVELENFRSIFEYTLDEELEDELDAAQETPLEEH